MTPDNDKGPTVPVSGDDAQEAFAQPVGAPVVPVLMPALVETKPPPQSLWPPGKARIFLAALLLANLVFMAAWNISALFSRFSTKAGLVSIEQDRKAIEALGADAKYSFPSDDAWIHFQFARNLARHGELSFNKGMPSTGTTAPLWTFILAIGQFIFGDSPAVCFWYANCLNLIFFYFALLFIVVLSSRLFGSEAAGWFAAFFTVNECHMSWAFLSGMEISLFLLLMLAAFTFFSYERHFLAGLAAGLCFDARPIGLIIIAVLAVDLALKSFSAENRMVSWKKLGRMCGAWLIAAAPVLILYLVISGRILPNTFYAKINFYRTYHRTGPFLRSVFFHFRNDFFEYLAPFAVAIIVEMFVVSFAKRRRHNAFPLLAFSALFITAFALTLPATFQRARYIQPLFPVVIMFMTAGVVTFLAERSLAVTLTSVPIVILAFLFFPIPGEKGFEFFFLDIRVSSFIGSFFGIIIIAWLSTIDAVSRKFSPRAKPLTLDGAAAVLFGSAESFIRRLKFFFRAYHAAAARCILSGIILFGSMMAFVTWGLDHARFYVADCGFITDQHIVVGKWLEKNTEPESVIATHDIGAIAYFSRRKVVDLIGLVDPAMISYARVDPKVALVVANEPTGDYIGSIITARGDRAYRYNDPVAAAGAAAQIAAGAPEQAIEFIVYDTTQNDEAVRAGLSVLRSEPVLRRTKLLLILDDVSKGRAKWGWANPRGYIARSQLAQDFTRITNRLVSGRRHHRARRLLLGEDKSSIEIIGRYSGGKKHAVDYFVGFHNRGAGFFEDIVLYSPPGKPNRFVHRFSASPFGRSIFGVYAVKPADAGSTGESKSGSKAGEGR